MSQKQTVKKKPSPGMDGRLANIESKLKTIQDQIDFKFKEMEDKIDSEFQGTLVNFMNELKNTTRQLDHIDSDSEEIKKNTKSKRVFSLSRNRKRKTKKENVDSIETKQHATAEDLGSQLAKLLQNPTIQSYLSNFNQNLRNHKKAKNYDKSSGIDLAHIGNLLQNPKIQSLLKFR